MSERLPDDWQERMVEMVRGAAPLDPSWFAGGPVLSPLDQIGVYRNQYRLRLGEAVRQEAAGLMHLLGDSADDTVAAYLADCPSTSWTLNRVALRLADWLAARGAPPEQVEMARLDRAVQAGFEAAPGRPITPADLIGVPGLQLQPHVSLLRLSRNVHTIRVAALSGQDVPEVEVVDIPLVVFRRGIRMRHWEIDPGAWLILQALDAASAIESAIETAFAAGLLHPETMNEQIQGWFTDFASRDLVSPTSA